MDRVLSESAVTEEQLVAFDVGGETYGVDIAHVQEIIRLPQITAIPRAPRFVEGVINLRGRIIPVVDLRARFGLPEGETTKETRIVVGQIGDCTIGMRVDAVTEVLRVRSDAIEPPSSIVLGADSAYLRGVGRLAGEGEDETLIILLDTNTLLSNEHVDDIVEMVEHRTDTPAKSADANAEPEGLVEQEALATA